MPEVALKVAMSCGGCEAAVRRVLGKLEGVESVNVDMQQQKVVVTGTASPEAVLQTVAKTGKVAIPPSSTQYLYLWCRTEFSKLRSFARGRLDVLHKARAAAGIRVLASPKDLYSC
ncbi:hypothetical protein WJX72_005031 [[Myrmecia] bisecta]|uniref:HMA domain-containing protein n=1 Tax=[Myrmecia] bisecta TaxID=41462 RepID=A0AAW1PWS7_9CHLO